MPNEFDLDKKLRIFAENAKKLSKSVREEVTKNVLEACDVMVQTAKDHTPHEGDGKKRGFNVISNSLQDGWHADFIADKDSNKVGTITLTNDKSYAKYVQNGHKVSRHFVPWLYKDGMGTLSYETDHGQPLFGLVVGTKTPFVKGVDMVGPAIKAFNEALEEKSDKLSLKIEEELFKL